MTEMVKKAQRPGDSHHIAPAVPQHTRACGPPADVLYYLLKLSSPLVVPRNKHLLFVRCLQSALTSLTLCLHTLHQSWPTPSLRSQAEGREGSPQNRRVTSSRASSTCLVLDSLSCMLLDSCKESRRCENSFFPD